VIEKLIKAGRAVGIILGAIPAFCVAVTVQFVQLQWRTMRLVWSGKLDGRSPQRQIVDREAEKRQREVEAAHKRQRAHIRAMRREGKIVGAVSEVANAFADRIRGNEANDADEDRDR